MRVLDEGYVHGMCESVCGGVCGCVCVCCGYELCVTFIFIVLGYSRQIMVTMNSIL